MARERLQQYGPSVLADEDLIAIITGTNGQRTAAAVLEECGAVQALPQETADDLARIDGVTPRRAAVIAAAVELGRRTLTRRAPDPLRLGSPREVAQYLLPEHGGHAIEKFGIVSLNTKHRVMRTTILSSGTLDAALVHPALVFRTAAAHRAAAIVLFHNHPSGDPTPSADDVALTARLVEASLIMGIEIVDHVILAGSKYCSFKEMGRI
ncbi:MAG: DNA repair protein RadC [Chromatiales bacterium]|nr:DNA repair protein RadC [Chromatiales bacterium]